MVRGHCEHWRVARDQCRRPGQGISFGAFDVQLDQRRWRDRREVMVEGDDRYRDPTFLAVSEKPGIGSSGIQKLHRAGVARNGRLHNPDIGFRSGGIRQRVEAAGSGSNAT